MRAGRSKDFLRFDLVLFLEDLGDRTPTPEDVNTFSLFWHLFGQPAGSGYLDALEGESTANTRKVREILRDQAYNAVEIIANGFWLCTDNAEAGLVVRGARQDCDLSAVHAAAFAAHSARHSQKSS